MNINTKFNIGDYVWAVEAEYDSKKHRAVPVIRKFKVTEISVNAYRDHSMHICYIGNRQCVFSDEEDCYKRKEDAVTECQRRKLRQKLEGGNSGNNK